MLAAATAAWFPLYKSMYDDGFYEVKTCQIFQL